MIIKDASVLIHLAKLTILEKCCGYFQKVLIPPLVREEITAGSEKQFPEVPLIEELLREGKIQIKEVKEKSFLEKAHQYNIQRGEAEAVALYWQEKAEWLATDDDNVRKKRALLNIKVIGTPAILITLFQKKIIEKEKMHQSIAELKKIGWFSSAVLDTVQNEARL